MAEVHIQDGETLENALRRFKRKVLRPRLATAQWRPPAGTSTPARATPARASSASEDFCRNLVKRTCLSSAPGEWMSVRSWRNTMELSSPESIRVLMKAYGNPKPVQCRRGAQDASRPASKDRRMRCKCGQCRQCLDNARWERIFTEKFADPNYYTPRVIRIASPLTFL